MTSIASIQNLYNVANVASQPVLDFCESEQIAFLFYFPLATGTLARAHGLLLTIAARHNAFPAQIALAWLLLVSNQTILIPSTSSIAHLEQNYASSTICLDKADTFAIREAALPGALADAFGKTHS